MPHRSVKLNHEAVSEAIKAAPPITVTVTALASGLSLNNIIGIATLAYIVLQAGYLIWKWRREVKEYREANSRAAE